MMDIVVKLSHKEVFVCLFQFVEMVFDNKISKNVIMEI